MDTSSLDEKRARLWNATDGLKAEREAYAKRALHAHKNEAKIYWLRQEANLIGKAIAPLTPCRAGCSHCCHLETILFRSEAEAIGKEIGRKVATPARDRIISMASMAANGMPDVNKIALEHYTEPCTFLKEDRCSIYEHRPMACRLHFSAEETAEPCRIRGDDITEGVLYVDTRDEKRLYVYALMSDNAELADIRDWFPPKESP